MTPPARPLVMGIVNVTPDSFSDGGEHLDAARAIAHGHALIAAGADWLDIGGESTRPGAEPVSEADELARVIPVIEGLADTGIPLSIDTMKPGVARAAMRAGASLWNDVFALRADGALAAAAELGCRVCLMHMQGRPQTMQANPAYDDVVGEVEAFLLQRADAAMAAGIARERIWLDPGIGFGKTVDHNLALMRSLPRLAGHGFPILFGASRKRFIAALDADAPADKRLGGSIAAALHAARSGAGMIRVHDVRETVQALTVEAAIQGES
ncbi:MAG: dihydropteroate synthase [Oceanicaulis sp.]|uniref:dihydropteroate synthase n=1 Tax=Glycocaulis sp. TaxID=1969725 RepID=UPI0025B92753|nr:dihydropteroate synthase [Glycocaulis sp.]MCC5982235.1 dihydropteroate synthase [Oceanicaulis sp.]MCH8520960.1 dihydropteroate synthase [Glycocaulis sp.]